MSVPVVLDTPARELSASQERKLDRWPEQHEGARVVGWEPRRCGPLIRLPAFDGPYWVDRRGILRPVS